MFNIFVSLGPFLCITRGPPCTHTIQYCKKIKSISIFHENDNILLADPPTAVWAVFCQCSVTIISGSIIIILPYRERNGRGLTFQSKNTSSRRMIAPAHADRTTIQSGTISGLGGASLGTTSVITSSVRRLTWSGAPMYGRCVSRVATKLETLAGRLYPSYKPQLQHYLHS